MGAFTSPEQMRTELSAFITDGKFVDKMIVEYFRENKPAELPKEAPVSGYKPLSYKEPAKSAIQREDETYEEMMERGSSTLHDAIEEMLKGNDPQTGDKLFWRRASGDEMRQRFVQAGPEGVPFTFEPPRQESGRPCFRCGAARGCKHQ